MVTSFLNILISCPSEAIWYSVFSQILTVRFSLEFTTTGRAFKVWGHIGTIKKQLISGEITGPPAERAYAVDPVGVEIISPSAI